MERRKFPRAQTSAIVLMRNVRDGKGGPVQVELRNLSASGALLIGAGLDLEDFVRLDIRLRGVRRLRLHARVVRRERELTAVAFEHVPPDVEDAIQNWVLTRLELARDTAAEGA